MRVSVRGGVAQINPSECSGSRLVSSFRLLAMRAAEQRELFGRRSGLVRVRQLTYGVKGAGRGEAHQ